MLSTKSGLWTLPNLDAISPWMTIQHIRLTLATLVALTAALMVVSAERALPASEVDALAGGSALVDALFDDEGEGGLRAGFALPEGHPTWGTYPKRHPWRANTATPPLARWSAGVAIMLAPVGVHDRSAAHLMACLLMAITALWIGLILGGLAGLSAAIATLASSAALDASGGAGAGAMSALAMAAFLATTLRMLAGRGSAIWVGVSWGLLLACHPGALFLLIPLFSAVAIAWRPAAADPLRHDAETSLALPAIPLMLLAVPVIGVVVLVALWPMLWSETGRGLAQWLTDAWWQVAPTQEVMGETLRQRSGRAPQAFIAPLQWIAWTPWPLLLAWISGLVITLKKGREGLWLPILVLTTTLIVGGVDGGLFGARRALLPWLWVCTAITAGVGLAPFGRHVALALPALALALALFTDPLGAGALGAEARGVTPVSELEQIAHDHPGATVHIMAPNPGQRFALETLRWRDGLDLRWAEANEADWLVVMGKPPLSGALSPRGKPEVEARRSGVPLRIYRRSAPGEP